MTANIC